ncbi:hypothetical protein [Roseovarius sp.]|uniref:hypothetical protein n=1 Tax=Roseovarius sp. TaxID=1486281 RepID=UPI003D1192FE
MALLRILVALVTGAVVMPAPLAHAQANTVGLKTYMDECIAWIDTAGASPLSGDWFAINPRNTWKWGYTSLYHSTRYTYDLRATMVTDASKYDSRFLDFGCLIAPNLANFHEKDAYMSRFGSRLGAESQKAYRTLFHKTRNTAPPNPKAEAVAVTSIAASLRKDPAYRQTSLTKGPQATITKFVHCGRPLRVIEIKSPAKDDGSRSWHLDIWKPTGKNQIDDVRRHCAGG